MPELAGRDGIEARIAEALGKTLGAMGKDVIQSLGDPPDISLLSTEMWTAFEDQLNSVLFPELEKVFVLASEQMAAATAFNIDFALVNEQAADWARGYSFDLVKGINNTSRRQLQKIVSDFFEKNLTIGDLKQKITTLFGPVRAQLIAVTETTRAAAQGELALAKELGVREGTIQHPGGAIYDSPPAHVGCRCYVNYEWDGERLVRRWQTLNDELVCPICGPLHEQEIA
jgi:hypothetical protein